jgi:hypothetical protein
MLKRAVPLVVIAALAIPAAAPPSAAAQGCTFQGLAPLSTPIPPISSLIVGTTGTYNMSGATTCVGAPTSGNFSSSGVYASTLCGSGTWRGQWSGSPGSFDYRIEFTNGDGLMYIPDSATVPSGHVRIRPVPPGNCVTTSVSAFEVLGTFGAAIPDVLPDEVPEILPPGTREASADCAPPTLDVIDTPVAGGHLRLRVKQAGPSAVWVCVRVAAGGLSEGGKLTLTLPGLGGGGIPSVDSDSAACGTAPNNQAPGPHPILGPGSVGGQQVLLDTWSSGGEAWVCAELGTTNTRVKIAVPGVSGGGVTWEPDA